MLAHSIEDMRDWNDSYLKRMGAAHMTPIPTLKLFGEDTDIQKILDEVMGYQRIGGQIMFGTDVGFLADYNPTKEYELMSRAGLTGMQILASFTTSPTERFGQSDRRGRIAAGMDADLVILGADPAQDAANFAKVCATYRQGKLIAAAPRLFEEGGRTISNCPK
jgi:imidazolonepropionase-like amidohydrolase